MQNLDEIAERIRSSFDSKSSARDKALAQARNLTKYSAQSIRASHRNEVHAAEEALSHARMLVKTIQSDLESYPDLYFAGYTQDACKEFAEASIVFALFSNHELPTPEDLGLEFNTYLRGLAESVGELRRRTLDILIDGHSYEAERLLESMDDIYTVLVTMDYSDAVTCGLRRLTDLVRGITERTRGDLLISLRQQELEKNLKHLEDKLGRLG